MEIISDSVLRTMAIGGAIARNLEKGDILCLYGGLGSGKTVLTKGISAGLGVNKHEVISPTFVLIRQYEGKLPVYHFDLYRLSCAGDIQDLGYEEYLYGEGVSVIEWADRLGGLSPEEFLKIELTAGGENKRRLKFLARGKRYRTLLEDIREDLGD